MEQGKFLQPIEAVGGFLRERGFDWTYVEDKPSLNLLTDQPDHGCDVCSRFRRRAVYEVARKAWARQCRRARPHCRRFLRIVSSQCDVYRAHPASADHLVEQARIPVDPPAGLRHGKSDDRLRRAPGRPGHPLRLFSENRHCPPYTRDMLAEIEKDHPFLKETLLSAMGKIEPGRLLDTRFLDLDQNSEDVGLAAEELIPFSLSDGFSATLMSISL